MTNEEYDPLQYGKPADEETYDPLAYGKPADDSGSVESYASTLVKKAAIPQEEIVATRKFAESLTPDKLKQVGPTRAKAAVINAQSQDKRYKDRSYTDFPELKEKNLAKDFASQAGYIGGSYADFLMSLGTVPMSYVQAYLMKNVIDPAAYGKDPYGFLVNQYREMVSITRQLKEAGKIKDNEANTMIDGLNKALMYLPEKVGELTSKDPNSIARIVATDMAAVLQFGAAGKAISKKPQSYKSIRETYKENTKPPVTEVDYDPTVYGIPAEEGVGPPGPRITEPKIDEPIYTNVLDKQQRPIDEQFRQEQPSLFPEEAIDTTGQTNPYTGAFPNSQRDVMAKLVEVERNRPSKGDLFNDYPDLTPYLKEVLDKNEVKSLEPTPGLKTSSVGPYPESIPPAMELGEGFVGSPYLGAFPRVKEWQAERLGEPAWAELKDTGGYAKNQPLTMLNAGIPPDQLWKNLITVAKDAKREGTKAITKFDGIPDAVAEQLKRMIPQYDKLEDAIKAAQSDMTGIKDIGVLKDLDVSAVGKNKQHNPVVTTHYHTTMNTRYRTNADFNDIFKETEEFSKDHRGAENVSVVMTELNKPEWQKWMKEAGLDFPPDWLLKEKGLTDKEIAYASGPMRKLMQEVKAMEDKVRQELTGKPVESSILGYWPTSRGGPYLAKVMDARTGRMVGLEGYNSWAELNTAIKAIEKSLSDNVKEFPELYVEKVLPSKRTNTAEDMYRAVLMEEAVRKANGDEVDSVMGKIGLARIKAMEEYKRSFELQRAKLDIPGLIEGKENAKELVNILHSRLYSSYEFVYKARLIKDVLEPLQQNKAFLQKEMPNAYNMMIENVMRELGHDISSLKKPDEMVDSVLNAIDKAIFHRDAKTGEMVIKQDKLRHTIKTINKFAVANELIGKFTFLAANTMTIPLTSIRSMEIMARMGVLNPVRVGTAALDAQVRMFGALFALNYSKYKGAKLLDVFGKTEYGEYMRELESKGALSPYMWDDVLSMAERETSRAFQTKNLTTSIKEGNIFRTADELANAGNVAINTVVDKGRAWTSNPIEKATNYWANTFYFYMVDNLFGDTLSKRQRFDLTYELATQHTAQYVNLANKPMIYDQLGGLGELGRPYSVWGHTQLSQTAHSMRQIAVGMKEGKGNEAAAGSLSLLYQSLIWAGISGIGGIPLLVDYERLRRNLNETFKDSFHFPSLSNIGYVLADKFHGVFDEEMAAWIETKALEAPITDATLEAMGTPVDLAGSSAYSSFFERSLIAPRTLVNTANAVKFMIDLNSPGGATRETRGAAVEAAPGAIRPYLKHKFMTMDGAMGKSVLTKKGYAKYRADDPEKEWINKFLGKTIENRKQQGYEENAKYRETMKGDKIAKARSKLMDKMVEMFTNESAHTVEEMQHNFEELAKLLGNGDANLGVSEAQKEVDKLPKKLMDMYLLPTEQAALQAPNATQNAKILKIRETLRRAVQPG